MTSTRRAIFISYSHRDSQFLQELQLHLKVLERYAEIYWWADTRVDAGRKWRDEIREAIANTKVAILLISQHFLASKFIADNELPQLLEAAEKENVTVLPVILRPSLFSRIEELAQYQAINSPEEPLADLDENGRNHIWVSLAEKVIDHLLGGKISLKTKTRPSDEMTRPSQIDVRQQRLPTADLEIIISQEGVNPPFTLSFNVTAADPSLGINYWLFGPVQIMPDMDLFLRKISREVSDLGGGRGREALVAQRRLEGIGAHMVAELLPADLKNLLGNLRGTIRDILIHSNESSIPWELLLLRDDSQASPPEFLGEAFSVTRHLRGIPLTATEFALKNIAFVCAEDNKDPGMDEEAQFIQSLSSSGRQVSRIPARYLELSEAFAAGEFDGWHIAAHAYNPPLPSSIVLEHGERLEPFDLSGSTGNLSISRPLVFLSGPTVQAWAPSFLRAGAGAVIGPYWDPTDRSMAEFTKEFYSRILSGAPIGRAVREARLELKRARPEDLSWTSFTAFAHPGATVVE